MKCTSIRATFALWLPLLAATSVSAQPGLDNMLFTAGTTTDTPVQGRHWSYLIWQGSTPEILRGLAFAIYAKPGGPNSPGAFVRRGIVVPQSDPAVLRPLLARGANLGDNTTELAMHLATLFQGLAPKDSVAIEDQLSAVIRGAKDDPSRYGNLVLLARAHPIVNLALGTGFAEPIPPGETTYEIRQFDVPGSRDLAVVGRVTVTAGIPQMLPAPGPPVAVPQDRPDGHLNIRLRWGEPPELRRLSLLSFGFNVYRARREFAENQGWALQPPSSVVLRGLAVANDASVQCVNHAPIVTGKRFAPGDAANLNPANGGDASTFFTADDNRRFDPGGVPFQDGEQFYYFVTARDVLGRDGLVSAGTLATACARMPPPAPSGLRVENDYTYGTGPSVAGPSQWLRVLWPAPTNDSRGRWSFHVYRWLAPDEALKYEDSPSPETNHIAGPLPWRPDSDEFSFLDNGLQAPRRGSNDDETFWYTVRVAETNACGTNWSPHSAPAFGVLRKREGPVAPAASVTIKCLRPLFTNASASSFSTAGRPDQITVELRCARRNPEIDWAEFSIVTSSVSNFVGRLPFPSGSDTAAGAGTLTRSLVSTVPRTHAALSLICRVGLAGAPNSVVTNFSFSLSVDHNAVNAFFTATARPLPVTLGETIDCPECACREHRTYGPDGSKNAQELNFAMPPGAEEWKVYRRINDGQLTLVGQGLTNSGAAFSLTNTDLPHVSARVCYFAQVFDYNGNPSPMTNFACFNVCGVEPTPTLLQPTSAGDENDRRMTLTWFCPPTGVERFRLVIARDDAQPIDLSTNLFVINRFSAEPVLFNFGDRSITQNVTNSFLTPRLATGIGTGALFSVSFNVEAGRTYYAAVHAVGFGECEGPLSNGRQFVWAPPNPQPEVPWPARPLPPFTAVDGFARKIAAVRIPTDTTTTNTVSARGALVGVRIGLTNTCYPGANPCNLADTTTGLKKLPGTNDPLAMIFRSKSDGSPLIGKGFSVALYRSPMANAQFPGLPPHCVQVSPLISAIAYQAFPPNGDCFGGHTVVLDPFVAVLAPADTSSQRDIFLLDTQPALKGVQYRYLLVRFAPNGEIDQIIDAGFCLIL